MGDIWLLLLAFQLKHWLCDYPLQRQWMLRKGAATGWARPLAAHAAVHAAGTFLIGVAYGYSTIAFGIIVLLSVLDGAVHFVVDRIKAAPTLGGRWKPDRPYFWWALGADQAAHHVMNYVIIAKLLGAW